MSAIILSSAEFRAKLFNGMTIMYGGFMGAGTPERLVNEIIKSQVKALTIIGNDTAFTDSGIGPLVANGQVRRIIASHIGTNPETGRRMIAGELEVELMPQGTLAERIRCGGAGLGGVLTRTGLGTVAGEGKQVIRLKGQNYLLEEALRADLAIVKADIADELGNLSYALTARNFNPLIALAADCVVAQYRQICPIGGLQPEQIVTPAAVVDYLYQEETL